MTTKSTSAEYDVEKVRAQIDQLKVKIRGRGLVYLDNAATTLKPRSVIDRVSHYYNFENANVHRGAHWLAEQGTGLYEGARSTVAEFLGAKSSSEVVFTRGTTEAINLVAASLADLGRTSHDGLRSGDEIVVSELEHHSNIVPWQLAAERAGARLRTIAIDQDGGIDFSSLEAVVSDKTKVISISICSNVLATKFDPARLAAVGRRVGAITVVDAAQAVTSSKIEVSNWGIDFLAFSGHKLFAPFGIGALWGKHSRLVSLPPYQGGGSMIDSVTVAKSTWAEVPQKFEAGTPNVGGAVGLAEAIRWYQEVNAGGKAEIHAQSLAAMARLGLQKIKGVTLYGRGNSLAPLVSFNLLGVHPSDVASLLDQQGIAIRAGHHCCQPLMAKLGITATARASFSVYNTIGDVETFLAGVEKAREMLT